jgi:hypothetical protein
MMMMIVVVSMYHPSILSSPPIFISLTLSPYQPQLHHLIIPNHNYSIIVRTHLFYLFIYSAVALVQLESLRAELERVQMGLALMTLSVQKLVDIVTAPPGGGCCSLLDFLLPLPAGTCTMDSTG